MHILLGDIVPWRVVFSPQSKESQKYLLFSLFKLTHKKNPKPTLTTTSWSEFKKKKKAFKAVWVPGDPCFNPRCPRTSGSGQGEDGSDAGSLTQPTRSEAEPRSQSFADHQWDGRRTLAGPRPTQPMGIVATVRRGQSCCHSRHRREWCHEGKAHRCRGTPQWGLLCW